MSTNMSTQIANPLPFSTGSNPKQRQRQAVRINQEKTEDNRAAMKMKGYNWNLGVSRVRVGNRTFSRNQIASGTGMNRAHIARIFSGKTRLSLDSALRMASFMKVTVEELMGVVIPTNVKITRDQEFKRLNNGLAVYEHSIPSKGYTPSSKVK